MAFSTGFVSFVCTLLLCIIYYNIEHDDDDDVAGDEDMISFWGCTKMCV